MNKNKVSQNKQHREQNIRCKYFDRTHPRQEKLCPTYREFCNVATPIISRQSVSQLRRSRKFYRRETEHDEHVKAETSRGQSTTQTRITLGLGPGYLFHWLISETSDNWKKKLAR